MAQGIAKADAHQLIAKAATELHHLSSMFVSLPTYSHVKGHSGDPTNELAVRLAKSAARGQEESGACCFGMAQLIREKRFGLVLAWRA